MSTTNDAMERGTNMNLIVNIESENQLEGKNGSQTLYTMPAQTDRCYPVTLIEDTDYLLQCLADCIHNTVAHIFITPSVFKVIGPQLDQHLKNAGVEYSIHVLRTSEKEKTIEAVSQVCNLARQGKIERDGVLVAIGGGVLSDIVTTAASLIRRGVAHIRVPTTLLAQIDAAIGIKGAVNFNEAKSFIGCFYPPQSVLICPELLETLDARQIRCGLAEILKMAIINDPQLFDLVNSHHGQLIASSFQLPRDKGNSIISSSIVRMLEALQPNLFETDSLERQVDFGHTFSPIVEIRTGYQIHHGEAVAIDMALSTALAFQLGLIEEHSANRIFQLLGSIGLPIWNDALTLESCRTAMDESTRHRGGNLNLVIPTGVGSVQYISQSIQISEDVMARALQQIETLSHQPLSEEPIEFSTYGADNPLGGIAKIEHVVIDIGGTSTRVAHYESETVTATNIANYQTPNFLDFPADSLAGLVTRMRELLLEAVNRSTQGAGARRISIAFAGPVREDGYLLAAPTVFGDRINEPFNLLESFRDLWPGSEIRLLNDVTAAGYRFLRSATDNLVVVTVGSGIGNKTFLSGRPIIGHQGWGGEIGHIKVDPSDEALLCDCGLRGHLGGISSGRGALRMAISRSKSDQTSFSKSLLSTLSGDCNDRISNELIVKAFHQGDAWTYNLISLSANPLATALAGIQMNLGIDRFVLFGGFAIALGEEYRQILVKHASAACWDVGQHWDEMIVLGANDGASGLIGAGRSESFSSPSAT